MAHAKSSGRWTRQPTADMDGLKGFRDVTVALGPPSVMRCVVYLGRLRQLRDHHPALLDPPETQRRSRLSTSEDQDRFTLAAVLLRIVAGRAIGVHPAAVPVSRRCDRCGREHGRPQLLDTGLHASISHSSDLVVVALTAAGRVGVDVELVRDRPYRGLLPSVCTVDEQSFVHTPSDFYHYWTRKEAVLKAMGEGFETEMTNVVVAPPYRQPALRSIVGDDTAASSMSAVAPAGYAGAVAVLTRSLVAFDIIDAGTEVFGS